MRAAVHVDVCQVDKKDHESPIVIVAVEMMANDWSVSEKAAGRVHQALTRKYSASARNPCRLQSSQATSNR